MPGTSPSGANPPEIRTAQARTTLTSGTYLPDSLPTFGVHPGHSHSPTPCLQLGASTSSRKPFRVYFLLLRSCPPQHHIPPHDRRLEQRRTFSPTHFTRCLCVCTSSRPWRERKSIRKTSTSLCQSPPTYQQVPHFDCAWLKPNHALSPPLLSFRSNLHLARSGANPLPRYLYSTPLSLLPISRSSVVFPLSSASASLSHLSPSSRTSPSFMWASSHGSLHGRHDLGSFGEGKPV